MAGSIVRDVTRPRAQQAAAGLAGTGGSRISTKSNTRDAYKIRIFNKEGNLDISGNIPESYEFSLGTTWDAPFNQPLSELVPGNLTIRGRSVGQYAQAGSRALQAGTGITTHNKYLSALMWTGGSSMDLTLPFVFHAVSDPIIEVVNPMKTLMKLVAPSEISGTHGMLKAPGPTVLGTVTEEGDIITVEIGKFLILSPVVVESVSQAFDTQFNSLGIPIAATVNVTVKSFYTVTKEDIDKFFRV